jgi:hypothetical protein
VADAYQSIFVVLLESAADARAGPLPVPPSDALVADFDEGLRNSTQKQLQQLPQQLKDRRQGLGMLADRRFHRLSRRGRDRERPVFEIAV